VAFWSICTALGGLCQNAWQLAFARMGVAGGEAGSTPAAHAFVSSRFKADRRGLPLAVLSLAAPIGAMLGLLGGGFLSHAVGWRATFVLMGLSGLILSPLVLLVVGADRSARAATDLVPPASIRGAIVQLLRNRSYRRLLIASSVLALATFSVASFGPAFLMRSHAMGVREVGLTFGVAKGLLGACGLLLAGVVVDRLAAVDPRWTPRLPAIMLGLALPFSVVAWLASGTTMVVWCMAVANAVGLAYLAPTISSVQRLTPPNLRAMGSAFLLLAVSLIGGLGPLIVGMISDALEGDLGLGALGRALFIVPIAQAFALFLFWRTGNDFMTDSHTERAGEDAH